MGLMVFYLFHRTEAERLDSAWTCASPTFLSYDELSGHVPLCGISWQRQEAINISTKEYFKHARGRLIDSSIHREFGKVMCELMSSMMIPGGLVFSFMRSRDIKSRKKKGRGTLVWLVYKRIEVVFRASCEKKLRVVASKEVRSVVAVMASSKSLG